MSGEDVNITRPGVHDAFIKIIKEDKNDRYEVTIKLLDGEDVVFITSKTGVIALLKILRDLRRAIEMNDGLPLIITPASEIEEDYFVLEKFKEREDDIKGYVYRALVEDVLKNDDGVMYL